MTNASWGALIWLLATVECAQQLTPMALVREAMAQKRMALLLYHNSACTVCASLAEKLNALRDEDYAVIPVEVDDKRNQGLLNADKQGT
jgi:hypothetical protein